MSKIKVLWEQRKQETLEDFVSDKLTYDQAYSALCSLGMDDDHVMAELYYINGGILDRVLD